MTIPPFLPDAALLERYLAGECSPDEAAAVRGWVEADEMRRKTAIGVKALDATWVDRGVEIDVQQLWERVVARAFGPRQGVPVPRGDAADAPSSQQARPPLTAPWGRSQGWSPRSLRGGVFKTGTLRRKVWYTAASLGVGILGVVIGWNGRARHAPGSAPNSVSTYATANGERANITLPDGSTVALNVASRLDVPVDYAAGNHTVRLQGQALFTVTHHEGTPLTVIAGTTTARVLGTNFSVRHYSTDATSTVAVRDGKVAVGTVVLTASQLIEVGPRGVTSLRPADASQFSFAAGVLTIDSMPVMQAVPELNRWYAADIRFGDPSLEHGRIDGKFAAGSLSDLAEYLEFLLDARVVRHGRTLTLYHKGRG